MSPHTNTPAPPFSPQRQAIPGTLGAMEPKPDHGESSYRGDGRLKDKKALVTGGDSGIGRAVAIAFAREGADLMIAYLDASEDDDARATQHLVQEAGRRCELYRGDLSKPTACRELVQRAVAAFGRIDVLVNNAAHQASFHSLEEIPDEEWDRTFAINVSAMFHITKAALPHMKAGGAIINTSSVNLDSPSPQLLPYATTKGAIQTFTGALAQLLADRGIRANAVAPGPVWTPLIPSTMPEEKIKRFGEQVPMKRPAQPRELAPVYVLLASDEASYVSGATIAVTGGKPII